MTSISKTTATIAMASRDDIRGKDPLVSRREAV